MVFLWIGLGLVIAVLAFSYVVFRVSFYYANDRDQTMNVLTGPEYDPFAKDSLALIREAVEIPFEPVEIRSFDGLKLYGRLYLKDNDAPVHIEFHGYHGVGIRDFSGGMRIPLSMNENVLLVDQRSHGKSEGHVVTYGIRERRDVVSWIDFVEERFGKGKAIYLEGISMGAATVLTASDLIDGKNVRGIWADCPYSDPFRINSHVSKFMVKIPHLCDPFIVIAGFLFAHVNLFSASALKAVPRSKTPVRIIHGTADTFVPFSMSKDIVKAAPEHVKLIPVEGAPHGMSYLKNPELYREEYLKFMAETREKGTC